jgi:hypothetical protein
MGNLSNLYISQSFQSLAHLGTNTALVPGTMTRLEDGIGQSLNISFDGTNISSSGNIYAANLTGSGAQTNTGSLLLTASVAVNVLTFTKGDGSQFNLTVVSSGSVTPGTISGSAQITQLGFVSSSVTGSSLITASFSGNTLTFTKGDASTFGVVIPDVSGSAGNFVTTSSFNAYTASNDQRVSSLEVNSASVNVSISNINTTTASLNTSVSNINTFTQSAQISINALNTNSASVNTSITNINSATASLFGSASLALTTASVNLNTITFTKGDGTTFPITVNTGSGGGATTNTGSLLVTASAFINTITFTKGDGTTFPVTVTTGSLNYVTGSFGAFYDTTTQSGSAGVAYSMKLNNTDISDGVIISGSGGIKVLAAGTYDLQFSAQVLADTGADTVWIWLKKNGTNVADTSTKLVLRNNEADVAAWNFVVSANANDVFELAWQSNGGHTKLFAEAAASNYTAIPSVIATMNRVDVGGGTNLVSTASFNSYTSSNDQKVNSLIAATGSYATTGSNSFNGNQIITGSITSTLNSSFNGVTVGIGSGSSITNLAIGSASLSSNSGISNVGIGIGTLAVNKSTSNIAIGNSALASQLFTGTGNNIAIGAGTLNLLGSGSVGTAATMGANTIIGGGTATALVTGTRNTIVGAAAFFAIAADRNTGLGRGVLAGFGQGIGTGSLYNTAIGHNALFQLQSGSNNIAIHGGSVTGEGFVTGSRNIIVGQDSGLPSSMESNTIIGRGITGLTSPLANAVVLADGSGNIALQKNGATAAIQIPNGLAITGSLNVSSTFTASLANGFTYVGNSSNVSTLVATSSFGGSTPAGTVSSSAQIVAYGIFATTGSNSFNGNQRITGSLTMSGSIITVDRSGETGNVYMGQNALGMGTAGAQPLALGNTIAVAIGNGAMRFASGSSQNVAIGNNALLVTTGSKNFGMGSEALSSNTTGQSNVGIGTSALTKNTTGESNTAIGDSAGFNVSGSNNTFIGASSGYNISGSNNTILGRYQGSSGETLTNNIILADGQGQVKAQYSGSAWSLQDGIKLNVGSNKTTDVVSVNATLTVSNSLVTANSIILVTTQNSTTGPVYPAVVTSKGAGTFSIAHNFGGNLDVAYLIINPT